MSASTPPRQSNDCYIVELEKPLDAYPTVYLHQLIGNSTTHQPVLRTRATATSQSPNPTTIPTTPRWGTAPRIRIACSPSHRLSMCATSIRTKS